MRWEPKSTCGDLRQSMEIYGSTCESFISTQNLLFLFFFPFLFSLLCLGCTQPCHNHVLATPVINKKWKYFSFAGCVSDTFAPVPDMCWTRILWQFVCIRATQVNSPFPISLSFCDMWLFINMKELNI